MTNDLTIYVDALVDWVAEGTESPDLTATMLESIKVRDDFIRILISDPDLWDKAITRFWDTDLYLDHERSHIYATILGILYWGLGETTRAIMVLGHAVFMRADYQLAQLVLMSIDNDVPFDEWAEGVRALTRADCLSVA